MASTKPTIFHNGHDDDDVVTWEHLEDISTIPTENTSGNDNREIDNEAQFYHIENVDVESQRPTHGAPSGVRPRSRSVIRVDSWFGKRSES
ncbi:hypothetical protein SI65_09354 [Aspergillus cristatus]|uniref:Uncharacterized protein n=1 Tax=Aspergillus cristatus TaxID=573508 RepID=A0A1E3B2D4_ASPCR|nr:hypothetical protein SI65_09354 [Aspergillus cristatus]